MTSSNGNIFRVTSHLCGEFTGPRWIPLTKASDAELWCFFDLRPNKRLSKQWWGWWFETPPCPLRRHRNVNGVQIRGEFIHEIRLDKGSKVDTIIQFTPRWMLTVGAFVVFLLFGCSCSYVYQTRMKQENSVSEATLMQTSSTTVFLSTKPSAGRTTMFLLSVFSTGCRKNIVSVAKIHLGVGVIQSVGGDFKWS